MSIPDFGYVSDWLVDEKGRHDPIEMRAAAVAPGITLHDLCMAFTRAEKQAKPGDEYSGNPAKWPMVRGVSAVVDALYKAIEDGGYEIRKKP